MGTACLLSSVGLATPDFLLTLTPFLSNSLMQEVTSIFIPSSLSLVNSGTLFLNLYFHLPTTRLLQKRSVKTPLLLNWPLFGNLLLIYRGRQLQRAFFSPFFFPLPLSPKNKKKKKKKKKKVPALIPLL